MVNVPCSHSLLRLKVDFLTSTILLTSKNISLLQVQLRYEIENLKFAVSSCKCDVYIGVLWLKSTRFRDRVTSNIVKKFKQRLKEIFEQVEREILLASQ